MYSFNLKYLPFQLFLAGRLHIEVSVNRHSGAFCKKEEIGKSTRLNSSHTLASRMPSSA